MSALSWTVAFVLGNVRLVVTMTYWDDVVGYPVVSLCYTTLTGSNPTLQKMNSMVACSQFEHVSMVACRVQ